MSYVFHIIDRDAVNRKTLRALIVDQGHEAVCFDSASTYVDFFSSPTYMIPIAIMSDERADGINTVGLIKHIRSRVPFQKIAVLSLAPDFAHSARVEQCYVLPKPYKFEVIRSFVQTMVTCEKACVPGVQCNAQTLAEDGLDIGCPFAPRNQSDTD